MDIPDVITLELGLSMGDLFAERVEIRRGERYLLYIGEYKNLCLCQFQSEAVSRIDGIDTRCIAIVPDNLDFGDQENIVFFNPRAEMYSEAEGRRVLCRIPSREFSALVSSSLQVDALLSRLLEHQGTLWISVFESQPELGLSGDPRIRVLGPDPGVASRWNEKIFQFRRLRGRIPLPEFLVCLGRKELSEALDTVRDKWPDGAFVTRPYGAAGSGSFVVLPGEALPASVPDDFLPWRVSRFIRHSWDPTVLAVVANRDEVVIVGIADQRIEKGTMFRGSWAPSALSEEIRRKLKEYTRTCGALMADDGYRGFFGCDFVVDSAGDVFLVEINARKQGTTMEMACSREIVAPPTCPSALELEYLAVTQSTFFRPIDDLETDEAILHWGTYNYKVQRNVVTTKAVATKMDERSMFKAYAGVPGHLVLEHPGAGVLIRAGTFAARTVAVGPDRQAVDRELDTALKTVVASIEE